MRIGGGDRGGRRIKTKARTRQGLRPTSSRAKTAIFNILPHDLSGLKALDLFAGSGALGLEALSRGASLAVFVDAGREAFRLIQDNLGALDYRDRGQLLNKRVGPALQELQEHDAHFDLIFMDPPYDKGLVGKTLRQLAASHLLKPEGTVVVEHSGREMPAASYPPLQLRDQRHYGDAWVSFYQMG
jgi:16S rRNA (guanine966-N2)-methyltransferase